MPEPTNPREGESAEELSETAKQYLMYLDQLPDNADEVTPECAARANTYARALELIKDDPQFEPIVSEIREKFAATMERMGLDPSAYGMSETWTYWDMAKQKHINDHPDEQDPRYRTGDPMEDEELQDQIASRHLGWEIYGANSGFTAPEGDPTRIFVPHESLEKLDKDHANYPEIMALLQKEAKPENGTLSSVDLARLGALIRQNLGEEGVSVPEAPPELEGDSTPAAEMDGPARPFPPPDTRDGEGEGGRKSVLGRMWRGEHVTDADKEQAAGWERAAWRMGKTVDVVAGIFGARTLARLPDRWAKSIARRGEVGRIKEIIIEERNLRERLNSAGSDEERAEIQARLDELNLGEEEPRYSKIQQRMLAIREKLEESDYLDPEKKAALEERLKALEDRWITAEGDMDGEMAQEIDRVLQEHVGERTKKMDLLKEAISGVGVALGAFAIRAGALGAIALGERHKRLKDAKEGGRVSMRELIVDGARDMAAEMFGQGKIKDLRGKKKALAVTAAWAKTALPVAIALAGYSEVAEKGGGAVSRAVETAGERSEEIQRAWAAVSNPADAAKALIETLNFQETFHRMTLGSLRGGGVQAPEDLGGGAPQTGPEAEVTLEEATGGVTPLTAEELESVGTQPAEHSGVLSQEDLSKVAGASTGDPIPSTTAADSSGSDLPNAEDLDSTKGPVFGPDPEDLEAQVTGTADSADPNAQPVAPDHSDPGPTSSDALYNKANLEHLQNNPGLIKEAETTFERLGLSDEQRIQLLDGATPDSLERTLQTIDLESNFGVSSFDEITPEELQKVAAQLQGANAESADALLKYWQESHPEITPYIQEARAITELEQALGVNSFEGKVSAEELKKVITELTGERSEDADKLIAVWKDKGFVDPDAVMALRFPVEHASLAHAGFGVETADGKVALSLDLGKEGAPQHLEQVFYRIGIEDGTIGDEITNVEGARILNVGANMTALSEGHSVAGVSSETFDQYVTFENGQLTISDYEGFQRDVLDKLTEHSEKIITADNVANTGAVAYLDNIKDATWDDMAQPEGAEVNFDQAVIDKAEGPLFEALVEDAGVDTGLGENITDINFADEDTGTFNLAGEEVTVENGMITGMGDTQFDEPLALSSDEGQARLMEEANRIEALKLEAEAAEKAAALAEAQALEDEAARVEKIAELTKEDQTRILQKLGFGEGGQGEQEWEFLKNKPVSDLLDKDIEGHSGRTMDYLEGRHRGKLRKFIELAIRNGEISDPSAGGPQKIGEAIQQIIEGRVTEQVSADLANANAILATPELTSAEVAAATHETPVIVPEGVEQMHSISNPDGSSIRFDYGADGKIVGVYPHFEDPNSPLTSVNEGYRELITQQHAAEGTKLNISSYVRVFENNVRQVETMQQSLSAMEEAGNGSAPEAEYLRNLINGTTEKLESRFGDVLKDTTGAASTPDAGVDIDDSELPPATPEAATPETAPPPAEEAAGSTDAATSAETGDAIPKVGLEPIPSTEIPEGMTIKATPEADAFMRENGIRIFKGSIVGEKMSHSLDFTPEPGQFTDTGTTESIRFIMTDEGNLRATILDTDGTKDIVEVAPDGKIIDIQGAEGPGAAPPPAAGAETSPPTEGASVETPASPQDIKLALENLVTGILANMDNVSPEVLKSLDGVGLDDIAKLSDSTLLENMKEGATDVLKLLQESPPADADPQVIAGVTRGYKEILATIKSRLVELQAR